MRALIRGEWLGEFLDYARSAADYRVETLAWLTLGPVDGLYFVRPRDPRMVWNYLRELGPTAVWQKIRSRWAERDRNEKFVSCGIGRILEGSPNGHPVGSTVVFLAPKHPACVDRLVVPAEWVQPLAADWSLVIGHSSLGIRPMGGADSTYSPIRYSVDSANQRPAWWDDLAGWDAAAGHALPRTVLASALRDCTERLTAVDWRQAQQLPRSPQPIQERMQVATPASTKPQAVLFGYGNYAKTVILPNVRQHLDVTCIHEVDPLQLGRLKHSTVTHDSCGDVRPEERYAASLIAGYHHTHADLAIAALRHGAAAIVEKPIATDVRQLDQLLATMNAGNAAVYECFQRRYTRLNDFARDDLSLAPGDAVNYHAIVYEVPLPERHWYRWPNSRTRLTSNGCHWIDHFLFLNDFAEPSDLGIHAGPRGLVNVSLTLCNGACFTMVLTDEGSERIGVQDHVELRAHGRTVFIDNNARYLAEGRLGIIRRRQTPRQEPYARMYRQIAQQIASGQPHDARQSVRVSAGTVLALEELLLSSVSRRQRTAA